MSRLGNVQRVGFEDQRTPPIESLDQSAKVTKDNLAFSFAEDGSLIRFSRYAPNTSSRPPWLKNPLGALRYRPSKRNQPVEERIELYAAASEKNSQKLNFAATRCPAPDGGSYIFAFYMDKNHPEFATLTTIPAGQYADLMLGDLYDRSHPLLTKSGLSQSISIGNGHSFGLEFTPDRKALALVQKASVNPSDIDAPLAAFAMSQQTFDHLDPKNSDIKPNALFAHNTAFHFDQGYFPYLKIPSQMTGHSIPFPQRLIKPTLKGIRTQTAMLLAGIASGIGALTTYIVMEFARNNRNPHKIKHSTPKKARDVESLS